MLIVAALVMLADQLTKWWATKELADGPIEVFGPVRLALTTNTAGAFGLGGRFVPFLALAALVMVIVLATRSETIRSPAVAVAAGLVLGGALGNLLDRLFRSPGMLRGAVIDFVDLRFWPVFNLADSAITVGCLLLLLWSLRPDPSPKAG